MAKKNASQSASCTNCFARYLSRTKRKSVLRLYYTQKIVIERPVYKAELNRICETILMAAAGKSSDVAKAKMYGQGQCQV